MCSDPVRPALSRRAVLGGAAIGIATLALTGAGSTALAAADGFGADGSGDPTPPQVLPGESPSPAAGSTSQNRWPVPAVNDPAAIGVVSTLVPGTSVSLALVQGAVTTVLGHLASQFHRTVEPLVGTQTGGFSWRENVNSPGTWSNHASGTAIDLNASKHPNGSRGTFSAAQVEAIRVILDTCRGVVRWGGDYTGVTDEMHFEINVVPGDSRLELLARDLESTTRRLALVLDDPTWLPVKQGSLYAGWADLGAGVRRVSMDGTRIAVVLTTGVALLKDGGLQSSWSLLGEGVDDVAVGGGRIGLLMKDGSVRVSEGLALGSATTVRPRACTRVVLHGNRIGVIENGTARVLEGSVNGSWTDVGARATDLSLTSRRVGVVTDGQAQIRVGALSSPPVTLTPGQRIAISGDRIAVVAGAGLYTKTGPYGSWTTQATGDIRDVCVVGDRVGVVVSGVAHVKQGGLDAGWVLQASGCTSMAIAG